MNSTPNYSTVHRINAPDWFEDPQFLEWLNCQDSSAKPATWHIPGKPPTEYSNVFIVWFNGGCSDWPPIPNKGGIPNHIWKQVEDDLNKHYLNNTGVVVVWITNLKEN